MTAVHYPLVIEQGATFRLPTTWGTLGPVDASGNPTVIAPFYDWTGATAKMQLREKYGTPVLIQITQASGITFGPNGLLTLRITDELTDTIEVKKAFYDLEVTYANGDTDRLMKGPVTIDPAVTRELP